LKHPFAGIRLTVETSGDPRPTRLELEVRFDAEPIRGRVSRDERDGRSERPFSGWLGLISAIEAARVAQLPGGDGQGGIR